MEDPKTIDHNPDERRPTNGIWWAAWFIVALLWIGQIYLEGWSSIQWDQVGIAAFTMGVLATWAMETTGNKLPSWMVPKGKPRVRR